MTAPIPQNLGLLFKSTVGRYPDKNAVGSKVNGRYLWATWREFADRVDRVALAFLNKGLKVGDRIAILSENRPEWALVDLAAQSVGVATVPIYTSLTPVEIQYLLQDSGCKAIAVSGKELFLKLLPIQNALPSLSFVVGFDETLQAEAATCRVSFSLLKDFEKEPLTSEGARLLEEKMRAVTPEDLSSLIYTSGTTGPPKGVMLSHDNFIQNVMACETALKMDTTDIHLSFLPLSHVFERMAGHYLMIHIGARIAYAESMDVILQNLSEVRPTFILGVPRFYEKVRERVLEGVGSGPILRRRIFYWAKGKTNFLAQRLVHRKFKARLGGRVRFCVSGGAALAVDVAEFFKDLGVMIYEGYGLTETSPVISVNREKRFKFGTVGIPLENAQVRITEEGEIATSGPCVMKGYWQKPAETAQALKDGWFHTGDLGLIDEEGFLKITGRKKELIVTSGGKKVSPRPIEDALETDPYILRAVLCGEGKKFITALIVPRKEKVLEMAKKEKMAATDYASLLKEKPVYRFFEERIAAASCHLANFEKIKYFLLLENDFAQSAGELTPTLKVKRDVVFAKHRDALERLYALN